MAEIAAQLAAASALKSSLPESNGAFGDLFELGLATAALASSSPNADAVAPATMPRGAIIR